MKFYICKHCGNIISFIQETGVPVVCCGEKMSELIPNTIEASVEKHIPVMKQEGNKVVVHIGAAEHPMTDEHSIQWIALHTKEGNQRKVLNPGQKPECCFTLCDGDEVLAIYAYCNIHGLWKA